MSLLLTSQKHSLRFNRCSISRQGPATTCPDKTRELLEQIQEYEKSQELSQEMEQQGEAVIDSSKLQENYLSLNCNYNEGFLVNNIEPIRMFKDKMQLIKENKEKRQKIGVLETYNNKLKQEYKVCLESNGKMQLFLKQIQFTFKNDRLNQKANQTLLKATKTLNRQKLQSKNHVQKIVKQAKTNQIRELKAYLIALEQQKERVQKQVQRQAEQNSRLREMSDYNSAEYTIFETYQQKIKGILEQNMEETMRVRQKYSQEKSMVKIKMKQKQTERIRRENKKKQQRILQQLLKKEGYEYELQVLRGKMKQKNKRFVKNVASFLKQTIEKKKKRIYNLEQELKQKIKTQEYITELTKDYKLQLEKLRENHTVAKEKFEEQINKLSRQIQQWNRKYKAELIEDQKFVKKGAVRQVQNVYEGMGGERKIKIIKMYEIEKLGKKMVFYGISKGIDILDVIRKDLLCLNTQKVISLRNLYQRLLKINCMKGEDENEVYKLARYIIQDNNLTYTKVNLDETLQNSIAFLIFKNLVASDINKGNIDEIRNSLKEIIKKNFDEVLREIWIGSGKSPHFTLSQVRTALRKFTNLQDFGIDLHIQYIEYLLFKDFGEQQVYKLVNFERMCEDIVERKLVKDKHTRISKTTIPSIFEKNYPNAQVKQKVEQKTESS